VGAQPSEVALPAGRLAGVTDVATVLDHAHRQFGPLIARYECLEILFDLDRVGFCGHAEASAYPLDVGIDRDCRLIERFGEYHGRRLASDPLEGHKIVEGLGHDPVELRDEILSESDDRTGFLPVETGRKDHLLDFFGVGVGEICGSRPAAEQLWRGAVDVLVSRLGRDDCGDEELVWIPVVERRADLWVTFGKSVDH